MKATKSSASYSPLSTLPSLGGTVGAPLRLQKLAERLPLRTDLHIARKVWHASSGMLLVGLFALGVPRPLGLSILSVLLFLTLAVEALRLKNPQMNEVCIRFLGPIMRTHEVGKLSTVPYFLASSIFAIAVFPKAIAVLALSYLAVGDPTASFFGILYKGRSVPIFKGKSLHGTAAGFLICALMTFLYLRTQGVAHVALIRLSLLGGFAGALAEALPLDLDDNLTIPVISGFILWVGFLLIL